jgi:hypothetical protein
VKGRETFYLSIAEIQRDLDVFMRFYNPSAYCPTSLCH